MVQCEMCGTETSSPNLVKIEGAELEVCDSCTEFGTEVQTEETSTTSTKYSTSSSSGSSGTTGGSTRSASATSDGPSPGSEMFDDIDDIAQDYDDRIRSAREAAGLSQEELAKQLNEKASLIRKLEHGDMLPSDDVQRELEGALDIDLSAGGEAEETEWEGGASSGEYTLGDVVERKDS